MTSVIPMMPPATATAPSALTVATTIAPSMTLDTPALTYPVVSQPITPPAWTVPRVDFTEIVPWTVTSSMIWFSVYAANLPATPPTLMTLADAVVSMTWILRLRRLIAVTWLPVPLTSANIPTLCSPSPCTLYIMVKWSIEYPSPSKTPLNPTSLPSASFV